MIDVDSDVIFIQIVTEMTIVLIPGEAVAVAGNVAITAIAKTMIEIGETTIGGTMIEIGGTKIGKLIGARRP